MASHSRILIRAGEIRVVYSDGLAPYLSGMPGCSIRRASHVKPDTRSWGPSSWYVDLRPVGGGLHHVDEEGRPFGTRKRALEFEKEWLLAHWLRRRR